MSVALPVVCPAATPVAGPPDRGPSIICGVLVREEREGMLEPGELTVFTDRQDPSTVRNCCCGTGMPVMDESQTVKGHPHYTACFMWQEEAKRREERRGSLIPIVQTETFSTVEHGLLGG